MARTSDCAGSGGGTVNPEFVKRIQAGDRSAEDPNSPRNVINAFGILWRDNTGRTNGHFAPFDWQGSAA